MAISLWLPPSLLLFATFLSFGFTEGDKHVESYFSFTICYFKKLEEFPLVCPVCQRSDTKCKMQLQEGRSGQSSGLFRATIQRLKCHMWQFLSDCVCGGGFVLTSQWRCFHLPTSMCLSCSIQSSSHVFHHCSPLCCYWWIPTFVIQALIEKNVSMSLL